MSPSHTDPTVILPIVTERTLGLTGVFLRAVTSVHLPICCPRCPAALAIAAAISSAAPSSLIFVVVATSSRRVFLPTACDPAVVN